MKIVNVYMEVKIIFVVGLILTSCSNSTVNRESSLEIENDSLRVRVKTLENTLSIYEQARLKEERENNQTIYAFMVIDYTKQIISGGGTMSELRSLSSVFEIQGVLTEDKKYKLLDDWMNNDIFENTYLFQYKLENRELFHYSTYAEASRAKEKIISVR